MLWFTELFSLWDKVTDQRFRHFEIHLFEDFLIFKSQYQNKHTVPRSRMLLILNIYLFSFSFCFEVSFEYNSNSVRTTVFRNIINHIRRVQKFSIQLTHINRIIFFVLKCCLAYSVNELKIKCILFLINLRKVLSYNRPLIRENLAKIFDNSCPRNMVKTEFKNLLTKNHKLVNSVAKWHLH